MNEIIVARDYPKIAVINLNRPDAKNALDLEMRKKLAHACNELAIDGDVHCVVITGGEKVFSAGADLKLLARMTPQGIAGLGFDGFWEAVRRFPKPLIAAVNGFALGGGCELALHCDFIIAGDNAKFGLPEARVGIMPGAGGTQRLVRAVGKYAALHMLMTGTVASADRAYALGLVSELMTPDKTIGRALELACQIAELPPIALASIKKVVLAGADLPLEAALMLENNAMRLLFDTQDQKEGMNAFIEGRKPKFKGA